MAGTNPDDERFLTDLNEAMIDRPLDLTKAEDRALYVPVYDQVAPEEDPVRLLANQIRRSRTRSTAHLFSGYRGSGKSTELRRLQNLLTDAGYEVFFLDMDGYLDPHTTVGIGDYLLDIAGAFDDELRKRPAGAPPTESFWDRLGGWFDKWQINVDELSGEIGIDAGISAKIGFKATLKENPDFRRALERKTCPPAGAGGAGGPRVHQ